MLPLHADWIAGFISFVIVERRPAPEHSDAGR